MAELIAVAAGEDRRKAAVVFFHGLTGHPLVTWGGSQTSRERFWPGWLADEPSLAGLAIYTVAYEADAWESRTPGAMSLFSHGENVLATLTGEPALLQGPLALVGHSLGGIIIKQVLREAWDRRNHDPAARRLIDRLARVVFIATPHQGSWLPVLVERWGWFTWRPTVVTRSLKEGDEALLKLKRWYTNFCGIEKPALRHLVFRETHRTSRLMVVTEASADPGVPAEQIPIAANHVDIAKPASPSAEVYRRTRDFLAGMMAPWSSEADGRSWRPTGAPLLHREVRHVPGLAPRPELDAALDAAFGWPTADGLAGTAAAATSQAGAATSPAAADPTPAAANRLQPVALTNSGQVARTVAGMAGVGKTELARAFAWRRRASYDGVWWIAAETRESIVRDLAELGERLADGGGEVVHGERAAEETIARIEAAFADRPLLLVYDNAASPAALEGLVPRANAHVLVTSRWSDWYGTAEQLDVDLFSEQQAVDHLTRAAADGDREGAARLARDLGFLPLAIDHAASYRRSRRAASFDDYRARIAELIHARPGPRARANLYPASVHRTFTLALDQVMREHPDAEAVMSLAAFLAPDAIPLALAAVVADAPAAPLSTLASLGEVSLVKIADGAGEAPAFALHRLVQLVMLDRLEVAGTLPAALARAVAAVDARFPRTAYEFAHWGEARPLVPHARAVLAHAASHGLVDAAVARLAVKLAQHLVATGHFAGAGELLEQGIAAAEAVHGPHSNAVGVAVASLAALYERQGRYGDAVPLLQRDLRIVAATLGVTHPEYAASLETLAAVRTAEGRHGEAEPLLEKALAIREAAQGADHPDAVAVLARLASCQIAAGHPAAAEPLLRRVLAVTAQTAGAGHPDLAAASGRLAELLVMQGRYREAAPLLEQDAAVSEATLGPDNAETATALASLADLDVMLARFDRAEALAERALAIREAAFGTAHPLTAASLHGLGWLRASQGRWREAGQLYANALAIRELLLGHEHTATAATVNALGQLALWQGRYEDAEALLRRDLAISEAMLRKGHPDLASTLASLGQLMVTLDRLAEADGFYRASLDIRERALGAEHPSMATTLTGIGRLRIVQGRFREAAATLDRALDIRIRRLGPDHPWVGRTLAVSAELALREGATARAGDLATRSLDIRRRALPAAHPDIAQSLLVLVRVRLADRERFAARTMLKEAMHLLEPEVEPEQVWLAAARDLAAEIG